MITYARQDTDYRAGGDKFFLEIIDFRRRELGVVENIDKDLLNTIYPGLGERLVNYYYKGLQTRLLAYVQSDQQKYIIGQALVSQWNDWFTKNLSGIILALKQL